MYHRELYEESGKKVLLYHYSSIDSTQKEARRQLACCSQDLLTLFIADEQKAGMGTKGRQWLSPAGGNLYMTLVHVNRTGAQTCSHITLLAAQQLAQELISFGYPIAIKLPNDLFLNNAKVGGILAEMVHLPEQKLALLLGVGLNLNSTQEQLRTVEQPACSLSDYKPLPFTKELLIKLFIRRFYSLLSD